MRWTTRSPAIILYGPFLGLTLLSWQLNCSACPIHCKCMIKTNQLTVDCINVGYRSIPLDIPKDTLVLKMDNNKLAGNTIEVILDNIVPNLQHLSLGNCDLKEVPAHAFNGLTNLESLDLSSNDLSSVPSHLFTYIPNLKILNLYDNPIGVVKDSSFVYLQELTKLDLSKCQLSDLKEGCFRGLENLNSLNLAENQLKTLSFPTFKPMISLLRLDVHDNPLMCNCSMRPLVDWMKRRRIGSSVPPGCAGPPRASTRTWEQMSLLDFACVPSVKLKLAEESVTHVKFECQTHADPSASVFWYKNNVTVMELPYFNYSISRSGYNNVDKASTLTLYGTKEDIFGQYTCFAENPAGNDNETYYYQDEVKAAVAVEPRALSAVAIVLVTFLVVILIVSCIVCLLIRRRRVLVRRGKKRTDHPHQEEEKKQSDSTELAVLRRPNTANCVNSQSSALKKSNRNTCSFEIPEFLPPEVTGGRDNPGSSANSPTNYVNARPTCNSLEEMQLRLLPDHPAPKTSEHLYALCNNKHPDPLWATPARTPLNYDTTANCIMHNRVQSPGHMNSPKGHPNQGNFSPRSMKYGGSTAGIYSNLSPVGHTRVKYCLETDL